MTKTRKTRQYRLSWLQMSLSRLPVRVGRRNRNVFYIYLLCNRNCFEGRWMEMEFISINSNECAYVGDLLWAANRLHAFPYLQWRYTHLNNLCRSKVCSLPVISSSSWNLIRFDALQLRSCDNDNVCLRLILPANRFDWITLMTTKINK